MKTVNAYYSAALFRFAKTSGVSLDAQAPARQSKRIRLEQQDRAWQYLHDTLGSELGVRFGQQLQPADLGTLGYLLVSADTLAETLAHLRRFYPLVGEGGDVLIEQGKDSVHIAYQPHYQQARAVRVEAVLCSIMAIARQITHSAVGFALITLDYQPDDRVLSEMQDFAQCEVRPCQDAIALHLPKRALALPLHAANPAVELSMLTLLNADLDAMSQRSPLEKVQRLLSKQPYLNRREVAERMYMSERSLGRALQREKTDFAAERQRAQRIIATQALQAGQTVSQVAELLRYSDASAFIKAYKTWTGHTPGRGLV